LIENRTELDLHGKLKDKIADTYKELPDIVFGEGFGGITDIEVGPDGNLYILSHSSNDEENLSNGSIFKISKRRN